MIEEIQRRRAPDAAPERVDPPFAYQFLRAAVTGFGIAVLLNAETMGLVEGRLWCFLIFVTGFIDSTWGLYAIPLLGGLFLLDASKTYLLHGLDLLALGTIAGELRRALPPVGKRLFGWGPWPALLAALLILLLASSLPGFETVLNIEEDTGPLRSKAGFVVAMGRPDLFLWRTAQSTFASAAHLVWPARATFNWVTGMAFAIIACRRASYQFMRNWLMIGALAFIGYGIISLLNYWGMLELPAIRRPNPDPNQIGRMQGIAGHPGWLGEWIVLIWPGYVLLSRMGPVAKRVGLLGIVFATFCLLLTGARAAILGYGVAVFVILLPWMKLRARERTWWLRTVLPVALIIGGIAILAALLGGEAVLWRMEHLIRATDRKNYYKTSIYLLQDFPFGVGLGMHSLMYETLFTPLLRAYQTDHVTSHSLFLQLLVENGGFFTAVFYLGLLCLAREVYRAWCGVGREDRLTLSCATASLAGLLILSLGHYILYLRVSELCFWILGGFLVGVGRQSATGVTPRHRSIALLLFAGVAGTCMVVSHSRRDYVNDRPRPFAYEPLPGLPLDPDSMSLPAGDDRPWEKSHTIWTPRHWRTAVDLDVEEIGFKVMKKDVPGTVRVSWPDGVVDTAPMQPGDILQFRRAKLVGEKHGPLPQVRYLRVQVSSTFTPSRLDDSTDDRSLGVYLYDLEMKLQKGAEPAPSRSFR